MPTPTQFQPRRGTVVATFGQTGTYSTTVDMGGLRLVGLYSDGWPGGAGSLTFRSSFDGGTGWPVCNEAGAPCRVNPIGSGTFYQLSPGTVMGACQFLTLEVGTAGTTGAAGGGTWVLIGEP